jgi:hypothetical protein
MNHDWSNLPERFSYLIPLAEKYYIHHGDGAEYKRMVKSLRPNEVQELSSLYREIERRGDGPEIGRWSVAARRIYRTEQGAMRPITDLKCVFHLLAKGGVEPFAAGKVVFDIPEPLDWNKLPERFHYLIAPAEKYGEIQFDDQIDEFLAAITAEQRSELTALAAQIRQRNDTDAINAWRKEHRSVDHPEASRITWMLNLLTQLDLDW